MSARDPHDGVELADVIVDEIALLLDGSDGLMDGLDATVRQGFIEAHRAAGRRIVTRLGLTVEHRNQYLPLHLEQTRIVAPWKDINS